MYCEVNRIPAISRILRIQLATNFSRWKSLVVSQPRNSSCSGWGLDKREIAMSRLIPKDIFYFKRD